MNNKNNKVLRYINITYPDVNNGLGCRVTVWFGGCTHHCKGCQNKETWSFKCGKLFDGKAKEELFEILNKPYIKGVTFSGGDPMDSYYPVLELAKEIKEKFKDKDIWLYTGYTLEEINSWDDSEILKYIDYLVDGEYKENLRDVTLPFRGSSNQNIYHLDKNGYTKIMKDKF